MIQIDSILEGLLIGWILSWFGLDELFVKSFSELFNRHVSDASYYLLFLLIGAIIAIIRAFK